MSELFQEYVGLNPKDGKVAAVQLQEGRVRQLSQITGGTAVSKTVRGGSVVLSEILLNGERVKIGDYIIAGPYNRFTSLTKGFFESRYKLRGPLKDVVR